MATAKIVEGPDVGRVFDLTGDTITVGRTPDNGLCLAERMVSRHHAAFHKQGEFYELCDLNSTNGTYVNGQRIQREVLKANVEIRFGPVRLAYSATAVISAPEKPSLNIGSVLKKRVESEPKP